MNDETVGGQWGRKKPALKKRRKKGSFGRDSKRLRFVDARVSGQIGSGHWTLNATEGHNSIQEE